MSKQVNQLSESIKIQINIQKQNKTKQNILYF